jgi:putative hydrolase of the HAD superfamily
MKHPPQVVLFDLGNTLLYDDPDAWPEVYRRAEQALWNALHEAGVRTSPDALYAKSGSLLKYYYGLRQSDLQEPGMAPTLEALLRRQGIHISHESLQAALSSMYTVTQSNWHSEEDAVPTLAALRDRGIPLGALSNGADDRNARQLLEKAGLTPFFDLVLSSAAFGWRKPHEGIFRAALARFESPAERVVMVGDSYEADILGAHRAGLATIWITRRIRHVPAIMPVKPDFTVHTLSEIPALIA